MADALSVTREGDMLVETQHPAGFGWDYLEEGPTWRVRLTKRGKGG